MGTIFETTLNKLTRIGEEFSRYYAEKEKRKSEEWRVESGDKKTLVLTAPKLRELRWMTVPQIQTLFANESRTIRIDESPEAYRELRWMSQPQIQAIFGDKGP